MATLRAFLRLINRTPSGKIILLFFLMIASAATEGIGLLLLVPILTLLSTNTISGRSYNKLGAILQYFGIALNIELMLIAFVLTVSLRSLIQFLRDYMASFVERQLVDHYRLEAFTALLNAEWSWFSQGRRNDYANLLLSDVDRIGFGLRFGIDLAATIATIAIYLFVAATLSTLTTGVVMASGALVFWALSSQRRRALDLGYQQTVTARALHSNVQESLAGIKLSKLLGNETRHLNIFYQDMQHMRRQYLDFTRSIYISRGLLQVGSAALLAIFVFFGLTYAKLAIPELLTLAALFARLVPMLMSVQQTYYHYSHAMPALMEAEKLLDECRAAAEPTRVFVDAPWPLTDCIRLNRVNYVYPGRHAFALENINLIFPVRTTTAIIGTSGSGKSSLADILIGILSPTSGSITIDGTPLVGEARMRWRHSVAYVPQDPYIFHDSIRNNLLWGNHNASEAAMADALDRAAADFVSKLPDGLDTVVGDAGVRLSGGERQRIALARALLRKPSLLILDEATSALDVENELRIRDAIEQLHGDLTVVIIGHRLPTLEHADQVVRLESGRLAEVGRWSDIRPPTSLSKE